MLNSKSFLWDEIQYLPAGVKLWPPSGPQGFALAQWNSGYLRNVAQAWQELNRQHPEMFGLLKTILILLYQLVPVPSFSRWCNAGSQGRWLCQSSYALGWAPSHVYNGTRKVAETQQMVGTINMPTSCLSAKDQSNSDNSDREKLTPSFHTISNIVVKDYTVNISWFKCNSIGLSEAVYHLDSTSSQISAYNHYCVSS